MPVLILVDAGQSNHSSNNRTNDSNAHQPPNGLCLEKLGNSSYVYMVPHPDGSNRVFVCTQQGKIWLAVVPEVGSSQSLMIESDPFLDLSDQVQFATEMGLMSMAFHPNFTNNGRFFVAFNCDKFQQPGCEGRCSCNTDVGCDPSKVDSLQESFPCQFHVAVAEFTANGTTSSSKLSWKGHANSVEVRRIFTMGLPFEAYHAGQILFGPVVDGYMYFMIGDASHVADPYNFAQNKKSLLGKILRLDVDNIPSKEEISRLGLWGNYSIPKDNPYTMDKELEPEIWALGFSNPWRCSFDLQNLSRFICGDIGKDQYEEINIIKKGGNYGWRVYEGPYPTHPLKAPGGYTSSTSITPIFPIAGYNHDSVDATKGPASIIAGYVYRATADPCLYGWYIYTDLYSYAIWATIETTENSGNFSSVNVPFSCAHDSPMECRFKPGMHGVPDLGYVLSLSQDNNKDVYLLASSGVYRVAAPSRCGYRCSKEKFSNLTRVPSSGTTLLMAASFRLEEFTGCIIFDYFVPMWLV
ncbi:HIPL1 protein-like [Rutidosis leptorrhynchoides]|uniref:HIPL1 protein-like n=1 Tax=Rutidosis leptorrhynchoides TaxID=125765 RepID=UPI003A9944BA